MNIADLTSSDFNDGKIIYHFDVERHSIPLKQFLATANATQEILDNFNKALFDGKGEFELRVIAPEPGGLIAIFTVSVLTVGVIIQFLESKLGKRFIEGLTDHEPAHWGEKLGEKLRDKIRKLLKKKDITDDQPLSDNDLQEKLNNIDDTEFKKQLSELESQILAYMIVRFLELYPDVLQAIGFEKEKLIKAYKAKNSFYEACRDNEEVKAVEFLYDINKDVWIGQDSFEEYITQLPKEPKPENSEARRSRPKM